MAIKPAKHETPLRPDDAQASQQVLRFADDTRRNYARQARVCCAR